MAEWSKATVLKTVVPKGTKGSNPFSSSVQGTLGGFLRPPALWLRWAKPTCANAFTSTEGLRSGAISSSTKHLWRGGREAEGGGLLNRYTGLNLYREFESPPLRNFRPTNAACFLRFFR